MASHVFKHRDKRQPSRNNHPKCGARESWRKQIRPHLSVYAALAVLGAVAFRRTYGPLERDQWEEMLQCIALHCPSLEEDSISWSLEPSGIFSTKSLYHALVATPGPTEMTLL